MLRAVTCYQGTEAAAEFHPLRQPQWQQTVVPGGRKLSENCGHAVDSKHISAVAMNLMLLTYVQDNFLHQHPICPISESSMMAAAGAFQCTACRCATAAHELEKPLTLREPSEQVPLYHVFAL